MFDRGIARIFERGFLKFSYQFYYQAIDNRTIINAKKRSIIEHGTII